MLFSTIVSAQLNQIETEKIISFFQSIDYVNIPISDKIVIERNINQKWTLFKFDYSSMSSDELMRKYGVSNSNQINCEFTIENGNNLIFANYFIHASQDYNVDGALRNTVGELVVNEIISDNIISLGTSYKEGKKTGKVEFQSLDREGREKFIESVNEVTIDEFKSFYHLLKLTNRMKVPDDIAINYLAKKYPELYRNIKNNEFELRKELPKMKSEINKIASNLYIRGTYFAESSTPTQKYSFERQGFPIFIGIDYNIGRVVNNKALDDGFSRFKFGRSSLKDIFGDDATKLYFINAPDFEFLPMSEDKAERLTPYLQKTGVNGGYKVYYKVEFEILPIHLFVKNSNKIIGMIAFVKKADFFIDKSLTKPIITLHAKENSFKYHQFSQAIYSKNPYTNKETFEFR